MTQRPSGFTRKLSAFAGAALTLRGGLAGVICVAAGLGSLTPMLRCVEQPAGKSPTRPAIYRLVLETPGGAANTAPGTDGKKAPRLFKAMTDHWDTPSAPRVIATLAQAVPLSFQVEAEDARPAGLSEILPPAQAPPRLSARGPPCL